MGYAPAKQRLRQTTTPGEESRGDAKPRWCGKLWEVNMDGKRATHYSLSETLHCRLSERIKPATFTRRSCLNASAANSRKPAGGMGFVEAASATLCIQGSQVAGRNCLYRSTCRKGTALAFQRITMENRALIRFTDCMPLIDISPENSIKNKHAKNAGRKGKEALGGEAGTDCCSEGGAPRTRTLH